MVALPRPSSSRPGLVAPAQIRRAHRLDHAWLGEVGTRAFAHLGDYHEVLPAWLAQANVAAWIDDPTPRRGFTMIAFYRDDRSGAQVADLLAITVEPPWRGHGLGASAPAPRDRGGAGGGLGRPAARAAPVRRRGQLRGPRPCTCGPASSRSSRTSGATPPGSARCGWRCRCDERSADHSAATPAAQAVAGGVLGADRAAIVEEPGHAQPRRHRDDVGGGGRCRRPDPTAGVVTPWLVRGSTKWWWKWWRRRPPAVAADAGVGCARGGA
jgi:GNAT superfamily N-acetyltransferase